MTSLDKFHAYCIKHNLPDTLSVFALWEKVELLEEQNKLLKFQLEFARKMVEKLGES